METKYIIGKNIGYLRSRMELTQEDLADYLGMNRVEISYYENGQRVIPMDKLERLADLFGVEAESFYDKDLSNRAYVQTGFAFRSMGLKASDLNAIADFRRIIDNYVKMKSLDKSGKP